MIPKFKIWCKDKNEWEKDKCLLNENGSLYHWGLNGLGMEIKPENHIIVFSTGLTDKNSKEIYEGDIIATYPKDKTPRIVKYYEGKGAFVMEFGKLYDYFEEHRNIQDDYSVCQKLEIIGNIYENNNLIKESVK